MSTHLTATAWTRRVSDIGALGFISGDHREATIGLVSGVRPAGDSEPYHVAQGAHDAFWAVWLTHRDFLFQLCSRQMGGRHADAEDALARAQQKALAGLPCVASQITNLKGWLSRVTANVCRDIHRENQRRGWSLNRAQDPWGEEDETLASPDADAGERLLLRELEEVLRHAIGALPVRLRETAALFFLEESSYDNITRRLGISAANARKRIQEARALLQETVAPYLSGSNADTLVRRAL